MSANVDELVDGLLADLPPATTPAQEFLGEQFDRGLAWVHFPAGLRRARADAAGTSSARSPGSTPAAPRPPACATRSATACARRPSSRTARAEQKERYLRPLFTAEEIWCQLFSEPGAGSDVAGLSTRAVRDGDEWVLNGQKVWTTLAHISSFGLLMARTNPDVPKHKGMTAFLVDMKAPGRRGAAPVPDHRRGGVQRGLLHRRPHARQRPRSAARARGGASPSPPS